MFKVIKSGYFNLLVLLLCANALFAQEARFTVSVSKTQVGTGEPFEITFSLNSNGDRFTPPNFSEFQLLSGPNESTSMSSINGTTSESLSYSYDLVAVKEGTFVIGPAYIAVNGRRLSTTAIKITVVKGQPVQQGARGQGAAQANNMPAATSADLSKTLFLKAVVPKTNIYQGEQIPLNYRVYTRASIGDSRVDKLPDLTGFWSEDVKNPQQQVQWKTETHKGLKYNYADIKQSVLFPQHAGNITIDPFAMTFIVRVAAPSNDVMDQFFGGSYQDVKYSAKSTPVVIHVKPLPETGKPAGFSGAVGRFTVEASVDKTTLKANEPINYKITVSGAGNIKLLKDLNVVFPPDFEKYDPKLTDSVTENERGVLGSRVYNYLLIPRNAGDFTIDPVQFSYFNPATSKYVVLTTKSFKIKVNKGIAEANVSSFSAANKQEVKVLDKDIRYIKTGDPELSSQGDTFYGSFGYILSLLAGPLLCIAAFIYRNRNRKLNSDIVGVKSRRAGKEAARHLAVAQKQLTAKNTKEFYEAIFKGLYGYLSDKLNITAADLNKETIVSSLKLRSTTDQLISRLLETLDLCEMARYAPVTHISEQEVFEKAKSIINDIENEI